MKVIEHDSRNLFYRSPFGAVTTGTEITLRLAVSDVGIPSAIKLVYLNAGHKMYVNMPYIMNVDTHCIYETKIKMPEKVGLVWYYFEIQTQSGALYYGNNDENLGGIGKVYFTEPPLSFQITVYDDSYQTPDWFCNAVAYQIFVDRFYNGNEDGSFLQERQDIIKRNWGEMPYYKAEQFGGKYLSNDFFGGNLKGILKKLPYLKELGIGVLYLNPIFKAYSNHKYDTGDYKTIDPMFGDEATFELLCKEAGKLGIRILLDGVFNHTGSNSKYFNKEGEYDSIGAYQSKESPYYCWYKFMQYPEVYESWWGMTTLPHVEESSESYRNYILHDTDAVVKYWIQKGASGWRLDVVDELPGFFVKELRAEIKKQKKDAVIIGEVWEDASNKTSYGEQREYFLGNELDSVMNYPLRRAMIDFALGHIDAENFDRRIMSLKENYPRPAFYALLNLLSSHDVERIMTMMGDVPDRAFISKDEQAQYRLNSDQYALAKQRVCQVVAMQMTMPGVPCVYYGDEAGMQGYADPFSRQTYPWGNEDHEILTWYKRMIALRNRTEALQSGAFETVHKIGNVYGFIRYNEKEAYIILSNFANSFERIRLDVARYQVSCIKSVLGEEIQTSEDGIFFLDMPSGWVKIFKVEE